MGITATGTGKTVQLIFLSYSIFGSLGCQMFPPFYIDSQISVHRKFKNIDQLIFRKAKEIYFNEKFPIL
jgi:hypothetical protein